MRRQGKKQREKAIIPPEDSLRLRIDVTANVRRNAAGEAVVSVGRRAAADRRKSLEAIALVLGLYGCADVVYRIN